MQHKPTTIAELKAELAEIEAKLTEYRSLSARRERIASLIRQWQSLYGEREPHSKKLGRKQPPSIAPVTDLAEGGTVVYVIRALTKTGPLTLDELLQQTRALGWPCSGNDLVDKKRLYAAMYKRPKFTKGVDGKWKLVEIKEKAS